MEQILPTNEVTEVEGQTYINPQTGIDETNTFIDKLRATQGQQNQEIATDTQRLGTDIPSIQGGLLGSDSYFTSRYQTPMTNANIANLRATAQAQALNDVLANEQAIWKEKYRQAYRNYQKRAYNRSRSGGGGNTGGNNGNTSTWNGEIETVESPTKESYGVPGTDVSETDTHYVYTDQNTGKKVYVSKDYMNKIYDKNGNVTDDGAVILGTRRLLGL